MSVQAEHRVPSSYTRPFEDRGQGWVMFAGVLLLLIGTLNLIEGIAAISKAHFFTANAHYIFGDLKTWGWVAVCLGTFQLLVGLGVFVKNQVARWVGVAFLGLNAIAALLTMPAYPLWSLSIFAVDILALYGLAAHGHRIADR